MKRARSLRSSLRIALPLLIWVAASTQVACDNSMHFSPTEPTFSNLTPVGERNVLITGTLTAQQGGCLEATVLYDGVELPGARSYCSDPNGCARLELAAETPSSSGLHTISFQVLEQSAEAVEYQARGTALVTREGLQLGGVPMFLGPTSATLRPGESVNFDLVFTD